MAGDRRAGLPSIHSRHQLEFLLKLGRAQGWFGPMKGVYLGVSCEGDLDTFGASTLNIYFRRQDIVRQPGARLD